jgi:hypothetical protein
MYHPFSPHTSFSLICTTYFDHHLLRPWRSHLHKVDGVLWRWLYSRKQFEDKLKEWSGGDPFYEMKATAMYNGTFLSQSMVSRCWWW